MLTLQLIADFGCLGQPDAQGAAFSLLNTAAASARLPAACRVVVEVCAPGLGVQVRTLALSCLYVTERHAPWMCLAET